MKTKNPKLLFIQSIAEQAKRLDHQISVEAKSAIKGLQQHPKPYYTLKDVEELVETLKNKMLIINKEAHTEFSKKGLKGVNTLDNPVTDTGTSIVSEEENKELQVRLLEIKELEMKIEDYKVLLGEKDTELIHLRNQTGTTDEKIKDQINEMNKLQELTDEFQRESKQAKQDREKIEAEFETVGNALMITRLEVEELQTALGNKDIEIENLKSEVKILSSHTEENIKLKDQNKDLMEKINTRDSELNQLKNKIENHISNINILNEKISILEQENEDLLLDSGETSEKAVLIQKNLDEVTKSLNTKNIEIKELTNRFSSEIVSLKEELSEKTIQFNDFRDKFDLAQKNIEEIKKSKRSLETQIDDLKIELKGKETRIDSIELERDELREQFSILKIEHEKQKSEVTGLKSQVSTKNRELEELEKELNILREQQKTIAQDASQSRGTIAEIERQKDLYEIKIKNLNIQLDEIKESKERLEKKFNETNNELNTILNERESLKNKIKGLDTKTDHLNKAVETLRINLAKNPKYAILFVLQDIQQASVGELAKTVAIQLVFAARLIKELETEGWVHFDEDTGIVRLIKPLLEIN